GVDVGAGKYGRDDIGLLRMLQGDRDPRPGLARRAAADRVHHDHHRAFFTHGLIDVRRSTQLARADTRELGAHRRDERFRVWHALIIRPAGLELALDRVETDDRFLPHHFSGVCDAARNGDPVA